MFKWLAKLFRNKEGNETSDMESKDKTENDIASAAPNDSKDNAPKRRKHKLEIRILEADYTDVPDGAPPKWRPVNMGIDSGKPVIVEVADKKELMDLQQRYAMCDQKMEIIREIDPFVDEPKQAKPQIPQNNQAIPVMSQAAFQQAQAYAQPQVQVVPVQKPKPKIITIGDMQVKYDGDKVYQKQWVKLNSTEAANFRIVSDSNNKIVPLNGKHIECRKWVIVEEDSSEDDNDVMNGIGD